MLLILCISSWKLFLNTCHISLKIVFICFIILFCFIDLSVFNFLTARIRVTSEWMCTTLRIWKMMWVLFCSTWSLVWFSSGPYPHPEDFITFVSILDFFNLWAHQSPRWFIQNVWEVYMPLTLKGLMIYCRSLSWRLR